MNFRTRAVGVVAAGVIGTAGVAAIATPFIGKWEGLRIEAYLDPVGIPTICYGSTKGVELGQAMTKEECDALLNEELKIYLKAVDDFIFVPMPDTRRAALTSFTYNVGIENFKKSTLRRLMNEGQTRAACEELSRWVFAKGIKLRGLIRRRDEEKRLCLEGLTEEI